MKKIIIVSALAAIAFAGCKKKENTVSMVVTASTPVVTITGPLYFSIPIGGSLPTITAVAYDTFYKDSLPVVIDAGSLDNTTPGLYTVLATAKNKYGYIGSASVYVAVTNISGSLDLSGWYERNATPAEAAHVTKLATGLFMTSNVGGDDTVTQASAVVSAVFAVTSDTTIDFGSQLTTAGTLTASQETLSLAVGDTTYAYALNLSGFGTQVRTFVKQ